ncbi:hypothetical protein YC2023_002332 [Brassica napus]
MPLLLHQLTTPRNIAFQRENFATTCCKSVITEVYGSGTEAIVQPGTYIHSSFHVHLLLISL